MIFAIGIFFIVYFLWIIPTFAQTYDTCDSSNTTLVHHRMAKFDVAELNITRTINVTEQELCIAGCDPERNVCNYPNWIYIIIIMVLIAVAFIGFKYGIMPLTQRVVRW